MESKLKTLPGKPYPLGAQIEENGVNFSVFSQNAETVELLLFHSHGDVKPFSIIRLERDYNRTAFCWHVFVSGIGEGVYYAYRIFGPQDASSGHRFDGEKILIDPYSAAVSMKKWDRGAACGPGDNLYKSMRSVVLDSQDYDWEGDKFPNIAKNKLVIYEAHVGEFTRSHTSKTAHPGTFISFIEKIGHLKRLGVNAVSFLPIAQFDDRSILRYGPDGLPLKNYWGYSGFGFFAPHSSYCVYPDGNNNQREFRDMVRALHAAGIEVIIDVSFNHTDEGDSRGPHICFKGLDNSVYYMLSKEDRTQYQDFLSCGNTLNCSHPLVRRMIIDCLGFWVEKMHVDGFRFDEISVMTMSEDGSQQKYPQILWDIELSEKLSGTKFFIKNPDFKKMAGRCNFLRDRWIAYNVDFRNDIRRFVKGESGITGRVAARIGGSADVFEPLGYAPPNVVNFITAHEGFTLNDLVSYNEKHNWNNGEENRDGPHENISWNCSKEGPTDVSEVEELRLKQIKNFITILLISKGQPMILSGDEARRTQHGNNNAYCQDNQTSWFDWSLVEKNKELVDFFSFIIEFRKKHAQFENSRFFNGSKNERGVYDICWHGCELNKPGFEDNSSRALAFTMGALDAKGADIHVIMNMYWEPLEFSMPKLSGRDWFRVVDTSFNSGRDILKDGSEEKISASKYPANGRSVVIFISKEKR